MASATIRALGVCILVAGIASFFASPASAGVVVHYQFNGNASDSSANGNNGTLFGSPSFVAGPTGQANTAIFFNNPVGQQVATQYVALPNSASILGLQNSSFSVAINFMSTSSSGENGRLFGRNPSGSLLTVDLNAGGIKETYFTVRDTNQNLVDTMQAVKNNPLDVTTDGNWHWGVFVVDRANNQMRQYIDTNLVATVSIAGVGSILFSDLNIGRSNFNTTFGARLTSVNDFQLFDTALTQTDVNALVGVTVPEPASLTLFGMSALALCASRVLSRQRGRHS